ncbi:MAG: hypothetical protein M0P91_03225 [Sulfuricurvum sp.]|uniref:hypothetical protein n=1 Tax=Sulfuricurvum sp. TaxID=2025608 RepID=UPI0025D5AD57|nr:hypothetical protein [Sulfuricurvum sp.]MCK9372180.1 hypothetical protein [Sulfuricurvum sp.]
MPSSATPALKRQNHRIHPCNAARKNELLNHLITRYHGKSILIVTANDPARIHLSHNDNITLSSDETLSQSPDLKCDVLISYDLPDKAIIYMSRFARAQEYALILLSAEDQKSLYPIETLVGRTIIQEAVAGFEPDFGIAVEQKSKEEAKARRAERDEQNAKRDAQPKRDSKPRSDFKRDDRGNRDENRPAKKPFSGTRDDKKPDNWKNKDSKPRFVGKDENGKPIFEGKTRERNHYIDGTPRSDTEKAARTPYSSKPKFFGKEKTESDKPKSFDGEKKPYENKKPYDAKKSFGNNEKKPYDSKKPYEKKPYEGKKSFENGEKKPYEAQKSFGDKKPYGEKRPYDNKSPKNSKPSNNATKSSPADSTPKRTPRRINVKSLKPTEKSE